MKICTTCGGTMSEKIFEWRSWDSISDSIDAYYDVKLTQAIDIHPEGTVFAAAVVDREKGQLTLQYEGHVGDCVEAYTYKLFYSIGDKVDDEQQY